MPNNSSSLHALPPPMTVGRYVRHEFPRLAKYICSGMAVSMPVILGLRIKEYGFSWKLLAAGLGGLVGAWLLACLALAVVLPIAGWFKLHTRIKPIIPASIAMILAILGYVLVANYYS
ncbi:hypothetical protein [Stenotrophomonas geniculata]|uniref:Transmembrane protein n=1 Tax=Stenotrophomonas geniculata TaxID=86188 RepID=A0ABW1MX99_9GAMM